MTRERGSSDDTGMPVYPRLPVKPPQRDSEVKLGVASSGINRKLALMIAGALIFGGILGFLLRPRLTTDPKVAEMSTKLAEAEKASGTQKQRADGLDKELDTMRAAKIAAEKKLLDAEGQISSKASELEKATTEAKAAQEKLQKTFDKSAGSIDVQDGELHVGINTSSLFAPNSADLTPAGKAILDKVAATLKDIPEKQFLILGHTDDSPPPVQSTAAPRPAPAPAPAKGGAAGKKPAAPAKPAAPPPPAAPPTIRFVTNWELSAARALAVLHYLQDKARIDPRRLQAVALGQYHPISKSNRLLNRRVEIVVRKG
jgi:chemotaxis protein MotB